MGQASQNPLAPGETAPDFAVSKVQEDRTVSLGDYVGRCTLLLGLFPGIHCPFCRRAVAQMATNAEKLREHGVESLAIVATELENARLYLRFRPTSLPLAVDPSLLTHR